MRFPLMDVPDSPKIVGMRQENARDVNTASRRALGPSKDFELAYKATLLFVYSFTSTACASWGTAPC